MNEHPRHVGRRRLLAAMRPQARRGHVLAGLLCAVLGFALVTQVRQNPSELDSLRNNEVIALLQGVTEQSNKLEAQARELQGQLDALRTGSDTEEVARQVAAQRIEVYSVLAGTRAVRGPGIQLEIADPQGAVSAVVLLDAVQELRGAGAEAIQVGDIRVVARTAFVDDSSGAGVLVGSGRVDAPYRILAIGDAASLGRALAIPGGVLEQLRSRAAVPTVTEQDELQITARDTPDPPHYARPAPSATP